MFAPVYVLLPMSPILPAEALRLSLAPFERGGRGDLPDDQLAFHDETENVRFLHRTAFTFTQEERGGMRIGGGTDTWHLDLDAVKTEMAAQDVDQWIVRFEDIEPDLAVFASRFVRRLERHPVTGGYGRWLNPLGRWDWWDLGGRFDGRIQGERRGQASSASVVSSGPNTGRTLLSNVAGAMSRSLDAELGPEIVAEADANIELVSRLLDDLRAGLDHAIPGAVVLPPGSCGDRLRWIGTWPRLGPEDSLEMLGFSQGAQWHAVLREVYKRYPDHWAANVAYHF